MIEIESITDKAVDSLIEYIKRNQNEYDVYAVSVHGVGFEWRLIRRNEDKKFIYRISVEKICNSDATLYVTKKDLFDKRNMIWELTDKQYNLIDKEIRAIWRAQGERWQDRGLY